MPKFLIDSLKREYPGNLHAVYGTLNKIGVMRGNKETPKGAALQAKHDRQMGDGLQAAHASHPNASRLGKFLHPKRAR